MARRTKRAALVLDDAMRQRLEQLERSRTGQAREIERARVLLDYAASGSVSSAARAASVTRATAYKCIDKALAMGCETALKDLWHRPRPPSLTPEAKAWVVALACTRPTEQGLAAELWTFRALAEYIRQQGPLEGHPCLGRAAKATVHRILSEQPVQPHKVTYYLERRDPDFEPKMQQVLMVYQDVRLINAAGGPEEDGRYTVCVDEKPGVQALQRVAPDLPPVPGVHPTWARDYEYRRLGTASILAGIDLHSGHIFAKIEHRHRSREFIGLLAELDAYYPPAAQIRVVLDNHSAHISKETRAWLAQHPNRFEYVHTPTHGSWLNLAECLFSKMSRAFLRHLRVDSWDELRQRILLGVEEMNQDPVVFQWKKTDLLVA
ncbi:IS630 family transposase [Candidatus Latescibacterota bacterium]